MLELTEAHDGQRVTVPLGARLRICLPEIPSSGYVWDVRNIEFASATLVESLRIESSGAPGAGLRRCFVFECGSHGASDIEIALRRPWNQEVWRVWRISLEVG